MITQKRAIKSSIAKEEVVPKGKVEIES